MLKELRNKFLRFWRGSGEQSLTIIVKLSKENTEHAIAGETIRVTLGGYHDAVGQFTEISVKPMFDYIPPSRYRAYRRNPVKVL